VRCPIKKIMGEFAMQGRPRCSGLYMPGSNTRALEKAGPLPADALIFDPRRYRRPRL